MTAPKILALVGSLAAIGVAGVLVFGGANNDPAITSDARTAAAASYDNAPNHTDLLSEVVPPGGETSTGVTLPPGGALVGVQVSGEAAGAFDVESITQTPNSEGVWLELRVRNTGSIAKRFTAYVGYGPTP
jgi:hypothetical protein